MCQMYAIFEEVVGPQPPQNNKNTHQPTDDDDQGIDVTPTDQNDAKESNPQYEASRSHSKRSHERQQRIYGNSIYQPRLSSTLPRSSRRRASSIASSDLDDTESICSSNPLLDTISVLTYDPFDDSDDYCDLTERTDKSTKTATSPEGDRDSIGYAGSSSIDSGYKSFCPTPEIPDPSIYGQDSGGQTHPYSGFYLDSTSSPQSRNAKPRIMMGTKVISRQGHISPLRESPGSRRSDASLYDVNLDHLMYLRQSLLSAIQRCESSNSDSLFAHKEKRKDPEDCPINPVPDQSYTDSVEKTVHPSYTKTVRFNTDVKVTTVNTVDSVSEQEKKTCRTADEQKVQSKSILKDPLCANLRSQLEAGSNDCTLEEEIDSLLYGRAEFYDLENVDDFPCSYVTMIEDKYRSGKPSLAKVRKLKGDKAQDDSSKAETNAEKASPPDPAASVDNNKQAKSAKEGTTESTSTVLISKQTKCRFTEVARCMLEIIEDLQTKKLQATAEASESSTASSTDPTTSGIQTGAKEPIEKPKTDENCYLSGAEYHVYEEIDYDFVNGSSKKRDIPPPLPARPSVMFMKSDPHVHQKKRAPSPPPRKSRCPVKKAPHVSEGCTTTTQTRNRPKQRDNLYCLFSDRLERRNISRSLEREWRTSESSEDDYGFKKEFPPVQK